MGIIGFKLVSLALILFILRPQLRIPTKQLRDIARHTSTKIVTAQDFIDGGSGFDHLINIADKFIVIEELLILEFSAEGSINVLNSLLSVF